MCICCYLLAAVSGVSRRPARVASKCFERECNRVGADHLRVQQSCHQPLCVLTVAAVDQAPQCGPSPGESTGGHCEGVEELHREGKRRYFTFVGDIVHGSLCECVLCAYCMCGEYIMNMYRVKLTISVPSVHRSCLYSHDTPTQLCHTRKYFLLLQI